MAKRPRMGRNLNALLGSAAKERSGTNTKETVEVASEQADNPAVQQDSSPATPAEKSLPNTGAASIAHTPPQQPEAEGAASHAVLAGDDTEAGIARPLQGKPDQASEMPAAAGERLIMLGVEKIRRGTYQPRRLFDQELLQELADSIKAEGMIQPIIVRPFADGFELVAGERRWRAAQLAGIDRIPAIVRSMEDRSVAAVSVIENIQRKDLNPLEEAAAFERLCDEFGMTHKAVAEAVGRSRASVTNLMRLLELHDEVKVMVDRAELEMGHARALLGAPRTHQPDIARRVIKQGMTVRAVEKYVRSLDAEGNEVPASNGNVADPDIDRLSQKLSDTLGARVQISHKGNGAGKLQISYSSVSELQGILGHIK